MIVDELTTFERNNINAWADICRLRGDILPTDKTILENMFHLARMKSEVCFIPLRIESRDLLKSRKIIEDYPVTVLEKLAAMNAPHRYGKNVKDILLEAEEVILIFPATLLRNRVFMRVSEELRGMLDMSRCNVVKMELYTHDGGHVKFLLDNENYKLPNEGKIAYKVINSAL
jgi:hypothetical protein